MMARISCKLKQFNYRPDIDSLLLNIVVIVLIPLANKRKIYDGLFLEDHKYKQHEYHHIYGHKII